MKILDYFSGKSWWSIVVHFFIIIVTSIVGLIYYFNVHLAEYTKHGQEIVVPNLENLSLEEAQLKLEVLKLRFEVTDTVYSEKHDVNAIVSQLPSAGSEVKENRRIYLSINMPDKPKIRITEADLAKIKKDYISQVKINISGMGLKISEIDTVESPYKDYVVEAYRGNKIIEAGDVLYLGEKIRLEIGSGFVKDSIK